MATAEERARGTVPSGGKASKRGSVNNDNRLSAFAGQRSANRADWGGCDPRWLQHVVVLITELGGACTFGCSRDGGAYSLTLMLDGSRETLWFNGDAELDVELEKVCATLDTMR